MDTNHEGTQQPYTREPDTAQVYRLGHWEAMQIGFALDARADYMDSLATPGGAEASSGPEHVRALARVFSSRGDSPLFTIIRTTQEG